MGLEDGVIYWHVHDPEKAQEIQNASLIFAAFLGMLSWDLVRGFLFDCEMLWNTFRGPRWCEPLRLTTRIAYLSTRVLGFVGLVLSLLIITQTNSHCAHFRYILCTCSGMIATCFSIVFACRAYALCGRDWRYALYFSLGILLLVSLCLTTFLNFGDSVRLPHSNFCVWALPARDSLWVKLYHVYVALAFLFDLSVLFITLHKLVEGGLPALLANLGTFARRALGIRRSDDPQLAWGELSVKLLEQGVQLYVINEAARLFFIIGILVFPPRMMPLFIRGALICGFHPIILRMLLQGQAKYLRRLEPRRTDTSSFSCRSAPASCRSLPAGHKAVKPESESLCVACASDCASRLTLSIGSRTAPIQDTGEGAALPFPWPPPPSCSDDENTISGPRAGYTTWNSVTGLPLPTLRKG